ncbi:DUF4142 domain-containing protein [Litchfieldella xinjiangensis]|uniref:DUF4142 domain-containing protein n=1 Tax=Litchfieldella xinjiangensis TaxID=1166948 RepID=UPI0005B9179E|nr:DUF4142 domain-containing protein [Halomonas xinjiangensis]
MQQRLRYAVLMLVMLTGSGTVSLAHAEPHSEAELRTRLQAFHHHQQALATLADERGNSSEISELSSTFGEDHRILEEWLMGSDTQDHGSASDHGKAPWADAVSRLEGLEGDAFDQAMLEHQQEVHEQLLALLKENRPENTQATEFANHLKITHETLRKHMGMLEGQ